MTHSEEVVPDDDDSSILDTGPRELFLNYIAHILKI
jgi:hypothetical protein